MGEWRIVEISEAQDEIDGSPTSRIRLVRNNNKFQRYSAGGDGMDAWVKLKFPKLPDVVQVRLLVNEAKGLEQSVLSFYDSFAQKAQQTGLCALDLRVFTSTMDELRKSIEIEHTEALKRFNLAKRLASSMSGKASLERGLKLLAGPQARFKDATDAKNAYEVVSKLWEIATDRINNVLEESTELNALGRDDPGWDDSHDEDTEYIPQFGILEPLPTDALPLRPSLASHAASASLESSDAPPLRLPTFESERIYDLAQERCSRGELSVAHISRVFQELNRERDEIIRATPSKERVHRARAFKQVSKLLKESMVFKEHEFHRHAVLTRSVVVSSDAPEVADARQTLATVMTELHGSPPDGQTWVQFCRNSEEDSGAEASSVTKGYSIAAPDTCGHTEASQTMLSSSSQHGEHAWDEITGLCVSCLDRHATQVAERCGHLVYCRPCHRRSVAQEVARASGDGKVGLGRRARKLSSTELARTRVSCPICREATVLVARESFGGVVYGP